MSKNSLIQVAEQSWAEDEAYGFYLDVLKGWRHWQLPDWYDRRVAEEVEYFDTKVWNAEMDRSDLTERFKKEIQRLDIEHKDSALE